MTRPRYLQVFGSARSGTSLLQIMMQRYQQTVVSSRENWIHDLAPSHHGSKVLVCKRVGNRDPKELSSRDTIQKDLDMFPGLSIIDIVRDPRDVITSVYPGIQGYYCDYLRWNMDVTAIDNLDVHPSRILRVRFESLVLDCDSVQNKIGEFFHLSSSSAFSSYPLLAGTQPKKTLEALGGLRKLDPSVIGRWSRHAGHRQRIRSQLTANEGLSDDLLTYGYESDKSWITGLEQSNGSQQIRELF